MALVRPHLTDAEYWDKGWARASAEKADHTSSWRRYFHTPPDEQQLWGQILPGFLPPAPAEIVEIGSAPGLNLLQWRRRFGFDIVGVDFSPEGLRRQHELFAHHGLDDSHSLLADFLDPSFQDRHRERFDIVYSAGLIEHFTNPEQAVRAHAGILKPGGLLIVSIPNLTGFYRVLVPPEILKVHNLGIMQARAFQDLFDIGGMQRLFCGLYGRFNLGIAYTGEARRWLLRVQALINALVHFIPLPESRWTSPHWLFIGRKRPPA